MNTLRLNHIGIVVQDIARYVQHSIYAGIDKQVYDPVQQAQIALIIQPDGPAIELIQPENPQATTYNFLEKTGGGFHHLCYEIDSIEAAEQRIAAHDMKKIFGPVPAVIFGQRQVLFAFNRNREILEFLITN